MSTEIAWLLERAHRLKLAAKAAKATASDAGARAASLWQQLDAAQHHLAQVDTGVAGETRPDVKSRVEARRAELGEQIKSLEPQVEAAKEHSTRVTEFEIATTAVYERCQHWLDVNATGDVTFERIDIPTKGDAKATLARLEAEIVRLDQERDAVRNAPTARSDIDAAVRSYLDKLRGEPTITVDDHGNVEVILPQMKKSPDLAYFPTRPVTAKTLLSLLLWLDGDRIEQRLLEITDRIPVAADALPADVKRQRLHEISHRREAVLFEMGAHVRHAIEQGVAVPISKLLTAEHILGVAVARSNVTPLVRGRADIALPSVGVA